MQSPRQSHYWRNVSDKELFFCSNATRLPFGLSHLSPSSECCYASEGRIHQSTMACRQFLVGSSKKSTSTLHDPWWCNHLKKFLFHFSLALRGTQTAAYVFIYEHYRLYELPWDSLWTWVLCALGMDLGYYWAHRATHGNVTANGNFTCFSRRTLDRIIKNIEFFNMQKWTCSGHNIRYLKCKLLKLIDFFIIVLIRSTTARKSTTCQQH